MSCGKNKAKEEASHRPEDIAITEDFNAALGELLEEINQAVDVEIDPEHFDYDKGGVILSLTSENSYFGRFKVGIKYIQLIDIDGYSFALFDAKHAKRNMEVDFAGLTHQAQFLVNQPHVPIGVYKSLVIEFDFKDADTSSWVNGNLLKTFLVSDDGLTFGVDQRGYRVSVDLDSSPVLIPKDSKTYINLHINLDDSVVGLPSLDNALPDNSALMIFHPSLDVMVGKKDREMFVAGKYQSIVDTYLDVLPFDFMKNKNYNKLLNGIEYRHNESTQFFIDNTRRSVEDARVILAQKSHGYMRLEGLFNDDENLVFNADRVMFADGNHRHTLYRGMILGRSNNSVHLSSKKFNLNNLTATSGSDDVAVADSAIAYNKNGYKQKSNFVNFSKPFQYVTLIPEKGSSVLVHTAKLSGKVKEVSGSKLTVNITSINHISPPSIAYNSDITVFTDRLSDIKPGDFVVFEGYFYQDYFSSSKETKYRADLASLMVWLDEMPPNNALNEIFAASNSVSLSSGVDSTGKMLIQQNVVSDIPLTDAVLNKSHIRYKRGSFSAAFDEDDGLENLSFDDSASFYLETYSVLNPHVGKYDTFSELQATLQSLMADSAHIYSVVVSGRQSSREISANSSDSDYVKIRLRGRSIDSALARTIFDDDYHGEKKWGGLTLAQIGAIFGSVVGLLVLEYILEKLKIGPKSQIGAPDFCKPGRKSKNSKPSQGAASKAGTKIKSAGSAIGSIGGIASCLKKLSSYASAEPDLKRFSKQINSDALYVDGDKGKNSALLVLRKKKLTKDGIGFYKHPDQKANFDKILNASDRINEVFNKTFGGKSELKAPVSDMAMRMKMHLTPKLKKDSDVYIKMTELDATVRNEIIKKLQSGELSFSDDADKDAFQKALQETTKAQTRGKNIGELVGVFNESMGLSGDKALSISSDRLEDSPSSAQETFDRKLSDLDGVEKAFMKFQIDDSEKTRGNLIDALGWSDPDALSADTAKGDVWNIIDKYRDDIDIQGNELLSKKAEILTAMKEQKLLRSNVFFEFQADSLVGDKMIEDIKKTIISVETSAENKIDVKKLMSEYKKAKTTHLATNSKSTREDVLSDTLREIVKDKAKNLITPDGYDSVIKKRKSR